MEPTGTPAPTRTRWLRWPSAALCLQAAACAIVIWCLAHGGVKITPPAATTATVLPALAPATPAGLDSPQIASVAPLAGAENALASIDVVVGRNDTLERIFRRLKLDLADPASLRTLPGVRTALDSLRPRGIPAGRTPQRLTLRPGAPPG